ncbi:FemAB family PEP-CTERM system-associated protein [Parahaliea sp. F7430]|uniref:FemAB family PEP-CTERM system-associated protein n=1 Tax=Sediminihaliea albiluteola TaxID=2758564 RepID=A0A7W2TVN1_9GAMM|nr:FemAB family XrtA/PEP-CTERM system-associated protein [Sediminihaliea albiluteola]MBA6412709.1 FemAB family PEP-CTERM system-associated protein [Sediminihaliea albiluteola]
MMLVEQDITVRRAVEGDAKEWDRYVFNSAKSTFCHRFGWSRVLHKAFGHRPHFLLALSQDKIVGVLPLAEVKSRLFGHSLISLPFCVYGGILADSAAIENTLRETACKLAEDINVDNMELRFTRDSGSGWPTKDLYYTFRTVLDSDHEVNLKAIPNRQRAMIRKGIKSALISEETNDLKRLYSVYSESVRNLGTPVFSIRYLECLREEFGQDCRILMISDGQSDVAGVMSFYFRGEVLPYYGGSVSRARTIKGCNHFMYWELMRRSVEQGVLGFDFGRSKKDTGPFSFKKNWGFEPQPLPYEYYLVKRDELPNLSPSNPKYQSLIRIWQRLPLPLANAIGPLVAGSLG